MNENSKYLKKARRALRFYWFTVLMGFVFLFGQPGCKPSEPASGVDASASPAGIIGRTISFGASGKSEQYRLTGWSKTENDYTWIEGTSAKLALPVPADAGQLAVKMTLRGLIQPPTLPFQPVEAYANNQKVADWQVADTATFAAVIPAELTKSGGGMVNLELRIPKAVSPKSLGINTDERILGLCAYSIEVSSATGK